MAFDLVRRHSTWERFANEMTAPQIGSDGKYTTLGLPITPNSSRKVSGCAEANSS